jgi:hypothetical protein
MDEPGERRLSGQPGGPDGRGWRFRRLDDGRGRPARSLAGASLLAIGTASLTALAWALLRGVLELGLTALVVSALGGWAIGVVLRQARAPVLLAVIVGLAAWLLGLVFSWLLAMALLPGSSRTFLERLEGTPFVDWLSPQLGPLEVAGLLLTVAAAAYGARPAARRAS